ncbi:hypothetical protein ACJX0J_027371 [Zea mays]
MLTFLFPIVLVKLLDYSLPHLLRMIVKIKISSKTSILGFFGLPDESGCEWITLDIAEDTDESQQRQQNNKGKNVVRNKEKPELGDFELQKAIEEKNGALEAEKAKMT